MSFDEYYAPIVPPQKLPFRDTVSLSYSTYFANFIDALRASWIWLVVVAAMTGVGSWQQWSWMSTIMADVTRGTPPQMLNQISRPFDMLALLYLGHILTLLAGVSIAVAWHRLMILGEHPGFSGSNLATGNPWRYIGVGLLICLAIFLPAVAIVAPLLFLLPATTGASPGTFPLAVVAFFAIYLIGVAVALRLSVLLPARAVGDLSLTFKGAWNRTRGNIWRLFWGMLATTLPPLLLIQIAFLTVNGFPNPATFASPNFAAQMTAANVVFTVYYLLMLPIGIGFLSHAYRHFFQAPLGRA
jgi:hypothetical protein